MTDLTVALAQMRCEKGDWSGNLARTAQYMAEARTAGAHVAVFPEMGLSGYCDPARFPDAVQTLDSPWIRQFVALTAEHGIAASGGFIETNPGGKPFVTQILAQEGHLVGVYRKNHVVDEEAEWFSPGRETPVFPLRTPDGEVPCALAICADSDRPDLFAAFARQGARVVLHSSAPGLYTRCSTPGDWQAGFDWYTGHVAERLPVYAREQGLFIVVATQTGATVDEDFPGGTFAFGPTGECLARAPDYGETLLIISLRLAGRHTPGAGRTS